MARSNFVGRQGERRQLLGLLEGRPLVTVTGPAGIGKSRLLAEVARDLAGSVVGADLAALPPGADLDAVSAAVGATPEAVAVALGSSSGVLTLDNCEHVLDGAALFVDRLLRADERVRAVATSRQPLGVDGEHVLVLAALPLPIADLDVDASPAVQLFLDRAAAAGAAWDRSPTTLSTVAALCRQLDGLPLAIELAAARARALSPGELLTLMSRRLDLLRRTGRVAAGDRHRSLRAAIDVSVDLLDPEELSFLQGLAVLRGPFDADLARRVAAAPGADRLHTIDLLARLVDRSLVVAVHDEAGTRYQLLEVLREHAVEGLVRSGREAAVGERFVEAMVDEADRIVIEGLAHWSDAVLASSRARFHDLLAALDWCVEHDDDPARAYRLVLPLFTAVHESRPAEVSAAGRRVLARWGGAAAPWRAEVLAVLATAAAVSGDTATATDLGRRAIDAEAATDDAPSDVAALVANRALGLTAKVAGDPVGALGRFTAARRAAERVGAASFGRELAGLEALMLDQVGRRDEARATCQLLVGASLAAGDDLTETWGRIVEAVLALHVEDWPGARTACERATAGVEALRSRWWEGAALRVRSTLASLDPGPGDDGDGDGGGRPLADRWAGATPVWRQAVEAAAIDGSLGELALTLRTAAAVAARLGVDDVAEELLAAAPRSTEASVLPEVFPTDLLRIEQRTATRTAPTDSTTVLRLARAALARPPATSSAPPPSASTSAPEPAPASGRPGSTVRRGTLHPEAGPGGLWVVEYGGRRTFVRQLKGFADLAVLLARPGGEVHCLQLVGGADVDAGLGPVLDQQARRAYQQRTTELQHEIDDAHETGRARAAERAEAELDALVAQLSSAFGLGGRERRGGSSSERARATTTYRVRAAIRRLGEANPELGRHLTNAIRTGTWCSYQPEVPVEWELAPEPVSAVVGPQPANR